MVRYSIIVPVYKVEAVLPRCIESILHQTVPDFELILIDDGSPDGSGAICDRYMEMDSRVKVIHQINSGVSSARNRGLEIAQGQYVVFIDSDDFVNPNYLEIFDTSSSDLVVSGTTVYNSCGEIEQTLSHSVSKRSVSSEEDRIALLKQWYAIQVWGKRFTRRIIIDNQLLFDPAVSYGEDSIFLARYLLAISDVECVPIAAYCFCKTEAPSLSKLNENDYFLSYTVLQEKLISVFLSHPRTQHYLAERYCWAAENEIIKICKKTISIARKKALLKKVLSSMHLSTCLKICHDSLSPRTRFLYTIKSPVLALIIYSNR